MLVRNLFLIAILTIALPLSANAKLNVEVDTPKVALANAFIAPLDDLLKAHVYPMILGVGTNAVDYDAWRKDTRHRAAMRLLAKADPITDLATQAERIAFWLNARNTNSGGSSQQGLVRTSDTATPNQGFIITEQDAGGCPEGVGPEKRPDTCS